MSDDLRTRIADVLGKSLVHHDRSVHLALADAVTDLLIDMAGRGELLKSIDRMYRDV
jgi:hypothetical protein